MDTNIIAKVDDKKNSYYYQYLDETKPKDVHSMVSGINEPIEDVDGNDLLDQIKNINQSVVNDDYNPDETIIDENIIAQKEREEELKRKANEERYQKEQEAKLSRQKDEEIERLKAELEEKNAKSSNKIKDKMFKSIMSFIKKDDDNELAELVASKEAKNSGQAEPVQTQTEPKKQKTTKKDKNDNLSIEELKYLAFHDENTGLQNKQALKEFSKHMVPVFSVIYGDIDNLALTNQTLGHTFGDKLIKDISKMLADSFGDKAYRIDSDEFVIILEGVENVDTINRNINNIQYSLDKLSDQDDDLIYSLSLGYVIGSGKTITQAVDEAKEKMKIEKDNYKALRPDAIDEEDTKMDTVVYNNLLSKPQQMLKNEIQDNHIAVTPIKVNNILTQIQEKILDAQLVFVASADFNTLLIYREVDTFIDTVRNIPTFDFSYIYVLYDGGPQYYGQDAYAKEVSHLFEDISSSIQMGKIKTPDDFKKIKGINIFQNICTDFM